MHCSQYSDVTTLVMVVGLSVDLLSPACVSHQGLLGNPNLTVAQILWILHILPHMLGQFFKKWWKKILQQWRFFLSNFKFLLKKILLENRKKIFLSDFAKAGKFRYKFDALFMCQNWPYQILGTSFWYLFTFFFQFVWKYFSHIKHFLW